MGRLRFATNLLLIHSKLVVCEVPATIFLLIHTKLVHSHESPAKTTPTKSGYWLIEFTSISRVIKKAPTQYARAYLYTETDDNDLTYFIEHQLNVICEAIKALHTYIADKTKEIAGTRRLIASSPKLKGKLNHRQLAVMDHFIKHSHVIYRIHEHQNSNQERMKPRGRIF
jgi:hypothetical protein